MRRSTRTTCSAPAQLVRPETVAAAATTPELAAQLLGPLARVAQPGKAAPRARVAPAAKLVRRGKAGPPLAAPVVLLALVARATPVVASALQIPPVTSIPASASARAAWVATPGPVARWLAAQALVAASLDPVVPPQAPAAMSLARAVPELAAQPLGLVAPRPDRQATRAPVAASLDPVGLVARVVPPPASR